MGMVAYFTAATAAQLESFAADPGLVETLLYPDDEDSEPANTIDLDKAWHGIAFLLGQMSNDENSPLSIAVLGGTEIGEDLGYGPARLLTPDQVRSIAEALGVVTADQLQSAFRPAAMAEAEIYPDIWERDGQDALDYLLHYFPALVRFYQSAAERGDGAVLSMA